MTFSTAIYSSYAPLKRMCSTKEHKFLKNTAQEPRLLDEIYVLCDTGTQDTPNLVCWKAEVVRLTVSDNQGVFSAAVLSY